MAQAKRIHKDYDVFFQTFGESVQTKVTILSPERFDSSDEMRMVEPGRTILIGNVEAELRRLIEEIGKPTINRLTSTDTREGGILSSRSYAALRDHLFNGELPRARPDLRLN